MICVIYAAAGVLIGIGLVGLYLRLNKLACMDKRFMGWSNHSTWVTHLWLTKNKDNRRYWTKRASELSVDALADELLQAHTEQVVDVGFTVRDGWKQAAASDMVNEVNWIEIAKDFTERSVLRFDKTDP